MSNAKPLRSLIEGHLVFLREFLKHPLQLGWMTSSSRFLERRVVKVAGVSSARTIVELGPGTGGTTRAILRAMPQHANLLSIEINPHLYGFVSRIKDKRLIAHLGNASDLKEIISKYGLDCPEVIISGIPFSLMDRSTGSQIIEAISSVLAPGGRFVAYQVSNRVASLCQPILGRGRREIELLTIPPMQVYCWEKNGI